MEIVPIKHTKVFLGKSAVQNEDGAVVSALKAVINTINVDFQIKKEEECDGFTDIYLMVHIPNSVQVPDVLFHLGTYTTPPEWYEIDVCEDKLHLQFVNDSLGPRPKPEVIESGLSILGEIDYTITFEKNEYGGARIILEVAQPDNG